MLYLVENKNNFEMIMIFKYKLYTRNVFLNIMNGSVTVSHRYFNCSCGNLQTFHKKKNSYK